MSAEMLLALSISCGVVSVYTFSKKDYGAMGVFMIFAALAGFGWFIRILP